MAVMGLKTGTKTWSDSPQNEITKSSKTHTVSAHELNQLGQEDVGGLLNKLSDPNWVDPSKKVRAVGSDKLDKDAFMKLMLAQMKHQDPTNPMKSHEMAAQLAQFSQVEQLTNISTGIESLREGQKPAETFQALNFIGKSVSGDSSKLVRAKGDSSHDFNFNLGDDASEIKIKVRNNLTGDIVRTVDLRDLKMGPNSWSWNGLDERGQAAPAGEYTFFTEAKAGSGKKISVTTDFSGVISGVNYTPEGPVLLVGTQSVKLKDIKKIVDPSLMNKDQSSSLDLKNQQAVSENGDKQEVKRAGDPDPTTQSNLMDSVGMSNEMMARVSKETK